MGGALRGLAEPLPFVGCVGEHSNFKNFLRTRKIMVMHSNESGECYPRTLVDRQWKRYHNAVDVVVRLHDPTDGTSEFSTRSAR